MSEQSGSTADVDFVQLLTPEGMRVDNDEYAFTGTDEEIAGFYRDMVLTRRVDTEATALQRQGQLGLWASCLGQEAAQVGSGRAVGSQDHVFPTYRELGEQIDTPEKLQMVGDLGSAARGVVGHEQQPGVQRGESVDRAGRGLVSAKDRSVQVEQQAVVEVRKRCHVRTVP